VPGNFNGALTAPVGIPAFSLSMADGAAIKEALPMTGTVVVTGNYQFLNGTSMATPHVTGAVAFAARNFPGDTVAQRRQRVLSSVDKKSALLGRVATGGRLNLLRIVDANGDGLPDWQSIIFTTALAPATNGVAYSQKLSANAGSPPYAWTLAAGTLPAGLTLSSAGMLSGASSVSGSFSLDVKVSDGVGTVATRLLVLNVAPTGPLHSSPRTATFDNVSVTPFPLPWLTADVGSSGRQGSVEYYNSTYTVKGAGFITSSADSFRFVYQILSGDGEIKARILAPVDTGSFTRIGVMIRDSLTAGSMHLFMGVNNTSTFYSLRRTSTGGGTTSVTSGTGTAPNIWVRLVRSGDTLTGYKSSDGTNWTSVYSGTITMGANIYIGLAVCNGGASTLNTELFDNVTVVP
jgi:hypothetical protein